nr:17-beta-hydroxysteroid dehydrogenase type 6 [Peromyscus maniculatus bairdii]XP_042119097.1 17-beta-hydroxysteroid dehydrogenase type 6 [Peromyscus maniculatus bairdii]XP_042119098.1 17-beta-hydroxysteroid dehydrogenase type 6 [Peromyscus maniculatus bairdii]XP_042119099.1 17-beta-hydroxysteroid dehydrogenase type 6 [Peromyscus maniculatus bairdii]XP_042119100.1 17-beta-hydroxysteroid dehydrogenase type 6 [Peromyscus maniculatus bairdii]XP_042119101.1 17-beta-hydroxysteroid dehydrogenase typ
MWLYLVTIVVLYQLLRWYRERQVVSHLQDKYVFITGCDSGFGNLLARQLDMRGMRVLAACLTEKGAEELRRKTSNRLETVILDVTKTESIVAATQWVKERVGNKGLWGLVNNAGVFPPFAYMEWLKPKDCMDVFQVNLFGLIQVTLSMLPLVKKARGRIVNVSSALGRIAFCAGFYSCSKYGVEAFSDVLRCEIQDFGVKVSIIEPGSFRTRMTDADLIVERSKKVWEAAPEHVKEAYGQQFFDHFCSNAKRNFEKCSADLSPVTDCMEHALTSRHPRTRYPAGWDAQFIFIPLAYLPTPLKDYIFRARCKPAQAV